MKRLLIIVIVFPLFLANLFAQPSKHKLERIHAAKMVYITDRLHITVDQSAGFIPLYNEYETEIRAVRKAFRQKYKDVFPEEANDTTSRQYIDDNLEYQEKIIAIKRNYKDRFLKVISPQQLSELPQAEREFKIMLFRQIDDHRFRENRGGKWDRDRGRDRDRDKPSHSRWGGDVEMDKK